MSSGTHDHGHERVDWHAHQGGWLAGGRWRGGARAGCWLPHRPCASSRSRPPRCGWRGPVRASAAAEQGMPLEELSPYMHCCSPTDTPTFRLSLSPFARKHQSGVTKHESLETARGGLFAVLAIVAAEAPASAQASAGRPRNPTSSSSGATTSAVQHQRLQQRHDGYRTPNIDSIAKDARSSPTGTASRAAPPDARRS